MINIVLLIAYDGTDFFGWQKTTAGPSIEETLTLILTTIFQQKICLQAASRTDRGVHAEGQVVNFILNRDHIDCLKLLKSLNSLLPKSIAVRDIKKEKLSFHPTLDCTAKEYHYCLTTGIIQLPQERYASWHVGSLCLEKMLQAIPLFVGHRDFYAFCNQRKNLCYKDTTRTIHSLILNRSGKDKLIIEIIGNHFLYKMVRNIVGTLVYIGKGKIALSDLSDIINSKQRPQAGITAPAHGLCLKSITFNSDNEGLI